MHPYSRFDILVADPLKTLTTDDLSLTDDPLMQLQQEINALGLSAAQPDPFQGGALGLFGYDLGRRFETLPEHAQADIPCQIWPWGCMTGR
jgi:para-aminobenzoate synthetase component 1